MNFPKLPLLLVTLMLSSGIAMAQTPAKRPESGDGPTATVQKADPNATTNSRAAVKADVPKANSPTESGDGPRGDKKAAGMSTKSRAEVKADVGMAKKMPESGDGPTAKATGEKPAETKAMRAERRAAAKAKREAKMKMAEKPAATPN